MQFSSTLAILGIFLAGTDASRCKDRPGHDQSGTSSAEGSQVSTETAVQVSVTAPTSSSTLATSEPLVPVAPITTADSSVTSTDVSAASSTQVSSTVSSSTVSSIASSATSSSTAGSDVVSVEAIADAPAAAQMCTDDQETLLTEWGLVVSNFRVEESDVEGTVCTTYNGMVTLSNGQAAVDFTADANIVFDEATINDNKYYSNAGLGKNVPSQLSSVDSIPASYSWSRTNTTNFRGKSNRKRENSHVLLLNIKTIYIYIYIY